MNILMPRRVRATVPLSFLGLASIMSDGRAQIVTLDYVNAAANVQAVPLGSITAAGASLLLALATLHLLRRRKRGSFLAALLALGTALLAAPSTPVGAAPPAPTATANFTITGTSPATTGYSGFCIAPGGDWVVTNGQPNAITLTGIAMTDGYPVSLAAPPGVGTECLVGTTLPAGGSCYISSFQTAC
jgi:hypothetical protein